MLTDTSIRTTKAEGKLRKLSDSGGLQLWIQPAGSKLWRCAYRFEGKQKLISLGAYPTVTLAEARKARDNAKRLLSQGVDPSEARKEAKAAAVAEGHTFRSIAEEYVGKMRRENRAEATLEKTEWLLGLAYPALGSRQIETIKPPEVLAVLRQVEDRGRYETARRLRSTIGTVIRYAIATARAEVDPTSALRDALIAPKVVHRAEDIAAAATIEECEARIAALERLVGKQALELAFLKGALRGGHRTKSAPMSVITGPQVSPSPEDAG